jgi:Holliday junction resolvase
MSFRRYAGGGRRDNAEKAIVDALEAIGARVWKLTGNGNPDLLVLFQGRYVPLEVKTTRRDGGWDRLTANQDDIPWPVVRSVEDALQVLGIQ